MSDLLRRQTWSDLAGDRVEIGTGRSRTINYGDKDDHVYAVDRQRCWAA